jgi:hypothetical protein
MLADSSLPLGHEWRLSATFAICGLHDMKWMERQLPIGSCSNNKLCTPEGGTFAVSLLGVCIGKMPF